LQDYSFNNKLKNGVYLNYSEARIMDNYEIGRRIAYHRNKKSWNRNQLANKAGISPTYIYQLESGKKNPTVQCLGYICDALNVSLQQFFSDENEKPDNVNQLNSKQRFLLNEFLSSL